MQVKFRSGYRRKGISFFLYVKEIRWLGHLSRMENSEMRVEFWSEYLKRMFLLDDLQEMKNNESKSYKRRIQVYRAQGRNG
jgi:hypothetical protein